MSVNERAMPMPKLHLPYEGSSAPRNSERSPRSPRRVPSPLRHAHFRPLAMDYANSPHQSQTPCKYYNGIDDDEEVTLSEYCAHVRTVGYSTVGGKPFMSGKCPHCHRHVKSERQVCTPNATPPPSPWKNMIDNLQSPLRSPIRTSRNPKSGDDSSGGSGGGGQTKTNTKTTTTASLQSPLRSPFKGSFFGSSNDKNDDGDAHSPEKPAAGAVGPPPPRGVGLTRSPPRRGDRGGGGGGEQVGGTPAPWARSGSPTRQAVSPTPRANSPGPRSPVRADGRPVAANSLWAKGDLGDDDNHNGDDGGVKPWASSSPTRRRETAGSSRTPRSERGRIPAAPAPRGAERAAHRDGGVCGSPMRSPAAASSTAAAAAAAAAHSNSPGRTTTTRHSPGRAGVGAGGGGGTGGFSRGPRSPGPRSPIRSPWKGASFFGDGAHQEGEEMMELSEHSSSSVVINGSSSGSGTSSSSSSRYVATKLRGPHSPGPSCMPSRSPLRVKVDFFDEEQKAEEALAATAAAAAAATPSKQAKTGWKSPIRSPFKGIFSGGGKNSKNHHGGEASAEETE